MRSRAEGEMRVVRAGQVERIGIFELHGVTIGGSKYVHQDIAGMQIEPAKFHLLFDHAAGHLDRRVKAQQLFNAAANQIRPVPETVDFVRTLQQGMHAVADQVARCLVTAEERHDTLSEEFFFGKNFSVGFDVDQHADEIVAFMKKTALRDKFPEILGNGERGRPGQRASLPRCAEACRRIWR
jgi:hypothetical protein